MSWTAIGEPKLDQPVPGDLPLIAPTDAWPHTIGGVAGNGRVALEFGRARTTRWTCELPEGPPVIRLLALGDRVLAIRASDHLGRQQVELIDGDGHHLRSIDGLDGDWAVDVRHAMLLGRTTDAELAAWSLTDAERPPILVFNRLSTRELDALRFIDDTLVIVTHQAKLMRSPPPDVLVDVLRISAYDDVSRWGSLRSRTRVAERIANGIDRVVLGFDPAGLILGRQRELWWGDWYLRERSSFDPGADLLPLRITPRGDGSSWMLAEREDRTELWQIAVGRCVQAFVISEKLLDASLLVAHDDAAVLAASSEIASYDADGVLRWVFPRVGAATGLIDPHGVALYSDAAMLISTDPQGGRATVWTAPDGVESLGPLAATSSRLWVGAGRLVFGLG